MSGHSKWAGIKHKKGVLDAKKGKVFTRVAKEIMVASREGGKVIANNFKLRKAIESARQVSMPQENIDRAILKGVGELPGSSFEEALYEGYGPNGVAILIAVTTDSKNRSNSELRRIFTKNGGSLSESGSVAWMFAYQGHILIDKKSVDEDRLTDLLLECDVEDIITDDVEVYEVLCTVSALEQLEKSLQSHQISWISSELDYIPNVKVDVSPDKIANVEKLLDAINEYDDVNFVYCNASFL